MAIRQSTYSKSDLNLLNRLDLPLPAGPSVRTNPYTHISHTLEPLALALYDFVVDARQDGPLDQFQRPAHVLYLTRRIPIRDWDRARYLFAKMWPTEYMDLLD
jgi:hypothetical protein